MRSGTRGSAPALFAMVGLIAGMSMRAAPRSQPPIRADRPFQTAVDLIIVTATVTDRDGRLVTGLPRDAFEVYEDGERQTIAQFTNERVPIGLGGLIDVSDSMFGKRLGDARAAVERFLLELLAPDDEFFILAFNHRPRMLTGWTRQADLVRRALGGVRASGGTAVYDAIIDALPLAAQRSRERTALLVISDGADTASNATLRDVRSALLRSDAFVYAIAIDSSERQTINTRVNPEALREITSESGGRTEIIQSSNDLAAATARIAEELNSQYVLGYTSLRAIDGQYHSLRVRVPGSDLRVRARNGYVAVRRP